MYYHYYILYYGITYSPNLTPWKHQFCHPQKSNKMDQRDQKRDFVRVAKMLTRDQAIRQIEIAIADYKEAQLLNNTEEMENSADHISATYHLYIFNQIPKTAEQILAEVDASHRATKFFQMDLN